MTNQDTSNRIFNYIVHCNRVILCVLLLLVVAVCCGVAYLVHSVNSSSASLAVDEKIGDTPVCVERLRQIGEWEFLCISDEEVVDTTRRRLFKNDELTRIYTGKLRLGVDMREMTDDAIKHQGDSIIITLPEVKLLDEKFIDEAATKSFYESGSWNGEDYELLYKKAQRQMKEQCLTKENLQAARENGKAQVNKMLTVLKLKNVFVK